MLIVRIKHNDRTMKTRSKLTKADIEAEQRAIHEEMVRLTRRLRDLDMVAADLNRNETAGPSSRRSIPQTLTNADMVEGLRVRCHRKDEFRGRTGTILGPHSEKPGNEFWDIMLDKLPGESMARTIYKMPKSLTREHT